MPNLPRLLQIAAFAACALPSRADVVLSIDLNDALDNSNDTAPGFIDYALSDDTLNIGLFSVDVNPAGGAALDDVHRATPANSGTLTLAPLYRDSVFVNPDASANFYRVGLDARIAGLTAGKLYTVTAWSYDSGSTGARVSDWSVLGMGGPQFAVNNYTFDAAVAPASDMANRFSVTARADESGALVLRGRHSATSATAQIFLNGITVDEQAGAALQPQTVLALDFNQRAGAGAGNTQGGFQEFLLSAASGAQSTPTVRTYGTNTVTLTPVGGSVDDRLRVLGDSGTFTESALLKDFIFGSATAGMDVKVQGLTANTAYQVELWSFDTGSTTVRLSDWTVNGANCWDDYTFNGSNAPSSNNDYKMVGTFTTNSAGELVVSGRFATGNSPSVFLNALRVSTFVPVQIVDLGHPIISEFLASNADGILDEDGDSSDWIEIWNTTAATIDLAGWRLTDSSGMPAKWVFPANVQIPSQARLLVWASAKDRKTNPAALHTNFGLQKLPGGYLALSRPDGTIVSSYSNLPAQFDDTSYGMAGTAEPLTQGYFQPPTPRAQNGMPVPGFVADTVFDVKRGYYSSPVSVHITCATAGAQIRYTTDGSEPTTSSALYPGAAGIPIATTTVLRAKAFAPPLAPSNTDTQTYLFRAQVQNQPANPSGWPATWGTDSEVATNNGGNGTVPADYEMDPVVVSGAQPGHTVADGLAALPSISIALNPADFHGASTGIYTNPRSVGDTWERAASIEFLELDGTSEATRCGIRVHGNSSRRPYRMQKHSFRVAFRETYGDGRFDYKVFPGTSLKRFDRLILHAFFTDGWGLVSWDPARYRPDTALSFRDAWVAKSFAEMGHAEVFSRHAHIYINGLYWGIFNVGERVDDTWCADHFGGLQGDYDLIAPGEAVYVRAGTATAWDSLFTFLNSADLTQAANYNNVAAQMDLPNFVDYYLLHVHSDAEDWPHHNGYAYRNRVVVGSKWKWIPWDQEIAMDPLVNVDRVSPSAGNTATDKTAGRLFQRLRVNPEFRLLFADRAHKHLHNDGALSLAVEQARWQSFADKLDKAIVAESARWGDTADATPYGNAVPAGRVFTREADWLPQVATVKNTHMPGLHNEANSFATITELRAQGLYPNTAAPAFAQFGGSVPTSYALTITAAAGNIYYTVNGTDPREGVTGNAVGTLYSGPVTLTQTCTVKARARNAGEWSALTDATFIVGIPASSANLAVTELHYDPVNPDHEFIELMNYSAQTIDLTGVTFFGLTFEFADGTLLAPGERIVVVRNQAAFVAQYGNTPRVAGQYAGALDNNGEELAVIAANDADIVRFRFDNNAPWPALPAGGNRSLVLRSPAVSPSEPSNWRMSVASGGTPGGSDGVAFVGNPLVDDDNDGFNALLEYAFGTSDSVATPPTLAPYASIELINVEGVTANYLTFTAGLATGADAVNCRAELATSLAAWDDSQSSVVYLGEAQGAGGNIIRRWRAAQPISVAGGKQFFRLKVQLP